MRVAYCIICHKNSEVLNEAINILKEDNDIYIHVDKKSDINKFAKYKGYVNFIENRVDVKWGSYSQIQATINILKEVRKNKNYDYIFLMSGDCLPLKNSREIKLFLNENKGKLFIGVDLSNNEMQDEIKNKVAYKYYNIHYNKEESNIIKKIINKIIKKIHWILRNIFFKNKYYKNLPRLYKGSNWFGITGEVNEYILNFISENPLYVKGFKRAFCGDEIFFQSIIMNSIYKNDIYKYGIENNDNFMALRYIDWKSGPEYPKVLDESDFNNIKYTDCIIGRKFNDTLDFKKFREYFIEV